MLDSESDDSDNDAVSANSFHGDHPQNYVDDLDDVIDDNDGIAASRDEDDDDAKFYDQFCPAPDGDEDCDEDEDEPLVLTDSETESLLQHLDTIELLSMARGEFNAPHL